jgi:hypothetical protein
MKLDDSPVGEAYVYVEQEEASKFKIRSDQLEQIGAQLRGRRQFSIFNSIILPIIVAVATICFSSLFQYVSWLNSVRVQNAADVTANAERAYERAAAAIGVRQYATIVFRPSLKEFIQGARTDLEAAAKPDVGGASASVPAEIALLKSDLEIKQERFASYYQQLKVWNENYDRLLTDIDYSLDRPVFEQAGQQVEKTSYRRLSQIDCSKSLTQELQRMNFNPNGLKLRFAGINKCFVDTHGILGQQVTAARAAISLSAQRADGGKSVPDFSDAVDSQIKTNLESLHGKANVFRCYALRRIEYYRTQKELGILSVSSAFRWVSNSFHAEAKAHFEDVTQNCDS